MSGSYDMYGRFGFEDPVPPEEMVSPGYYARAKQYASDTMNNMGARAKAGYQGMNEGLGGAVKGAPAAIGNTWHKGGLLGKTGVALGVGAGAYALGRGVVYPLLAGTGAISETQQEQISRSGPGRFFTGEPRYDSGRDTAVMEAKQQAFIDEGRQYALEEQERLKQNYRDQAAFDSEMGFQNAQKYGRLGLDLGTVATFRDIYAKQLGDSTANYLNNMQLANQGISQILNPRVQVI